MQDASNTRPFEQVKTYVNDGLYNSRCRQHPDFDLDTICFHPQCRQQRSQIVCYCCGTEQQPHASHTQCLHPIYKTSPAFRLVNFQNDPCLLACMESQQQEMKETMENLQEIMNSAMEQVTKRAQQRFECLGDFLQKNGIYKICSRIRHFGDSHSDCCLSLLNSLKDRQQQGPVSNSEAQLVVQKELNKHSEQFKTQIGFIRQQFQAIIEKSMNINHESLQQLSHGRIITSELIPLQQKFPEITMAAQTNPEQPKEEIIDVEYFQVKHTESMILNNKQKESKQDILGLKAARSRKVIRRGGQKKNKRPQKVVRISNEENRFSPIDLDQGEQPSQVLKSSLINQLIASRDIDLSKSSEINLQQQQNSLKNHIVFQQIQKCPIGAEPEGSSTLIIWNADRFDEIIKFLSSARHVVHLVIYDKNMTKVEVLLKVIQSMPWLEGLHLHCKSQITHNMLNQLKSSYFSYFPSYRFIQIIDREKYFPRTKPSSLEDVPSWLQTSNIGKFRNVFIQSQDGSSINANTEEVSFVQDNTDQFWVFGIGVQQSLLKADRLQVLVFSNILIRKAVSFKEVYERHHFLHTLVFDDCQCQHNDLVSQLRYLKKGQLSHLQLSGDNLDHKIQLGQQQADYIFNLTGLETLILTNVEFKHISRRAEKENSRILQKIQNLDKLTHLNLYNTEPVFSDILSYLSRSCVQNLRTLNLGCTEINSQAVMFLERFSKLEALAIDYTEIGEEQLLKIACKMPSLERLSIENLNGSRIIYEEDSLKDTKKKYGVITSKFLNRLKYKTLRYLNIYNCQFLSEYDWKNYPQLECLRINKGLLNTNVITKLEQRGVKIYVDIVEEQDKNMQAQAHQKKAYHSPSQGNGENKKKEKDSLDGNASAIGLTNETTRIKEEIRKEGPAKPQLGRSQLIISSKTPMYSNTLVNKN